MQTQRGLSKIKTQFIYKQGRYLKGTFLVLRWIKGEGKWCIATSRALGCHARRNVIKRRIKAALTQLESSPLPINAVITCNSNIKDVSFIQIVKELEKLINLI